MPCSSRRSSSSSATRSAHPDSTYSRRLRPWSRGGRWSCSATRAPFSSTSSPSSQGVSPASMRSSVVLPEPLRPERVRRSRRSSLNDTSCSSGTPATCFPSPDAIAMATTQNGTVRPMGRSRSDRSSGAVAHGAMAVGASANGALARGAMALGALAVGALAIGALAIGRLGDRAGPDQAPAGRRAGSGEAHDPGPGRPARPPRRSASAPLKPHLPG